MSSNNSNKINVPEAGDLGRPDNQEDVSRRSCEICEAKPYYTGPCADRAVHSFGNALITQCTIYNILSHRPKKLYLKLL